MCTTGTLEVSCMSYAITPGKSCKKCSDIRHPAARDSAFRKRKKLYETKSALGSTRRPDSPS